MSRLPILGVHELFTWNVFLCMSNETRFLHGTHSNPKSNLTTIGDLRTFSALLFLAVLMAITLQCIAGLIAYESGAEWFPAGFPLERHFKPLCLGSTCMYLH